MSNHLFGLPPKKEGKFSPLLPVYHANRDFFTADLLCFSFKSDQASMEAPFFSLSTKPDMSVYQWQSKDGKQRLSVIPSALGRATQMDKDVLIFIISQLMQAKNDQRVDADSRRVRFTVYDYLKATNKPTGGKEYERLENALNRLRGTTINTNIRVNKQVFKKGFGLIDNWGIVEKSLTDARMIAVEVELSKWLFHAICAKNVLTLSENYFRLRKPLERRIYEIARKHCGKQPCWRISVSVLHKKTGSKSKLFEFRRMVREIVNKNRDFPEYRLAFDEQQDALIFLSRDAKKIVSAIMAVDKKR